MSEQALIQLAMQDAMLALGSAKISLTHEPRTGTDAYGEPSYGAGAAIPGILFYEPNRIYNAEGEEVVSNGHFTHVQPVDVKTEDRLTLPDGSQPRLLRVDKTYAGTAIVVEKVYF